MRGYPESADKAQHYRRILRAFPACDFLLPAEKTTETFSATDAVFRDTTALVTAPSLTAYVAWILADAAGKNKKTLFFLARDGFVLHGIAKSLCRAWGMDIECRYLYCSRVALRLPLYAVNRDFALDTLCAATYNVTLRDILLRANITEEQGKEIAAELGIRQTEPLTKNRLAEIKDRLRANSAFDGLVTAHSKAALAGIGGYLQQEFSGVTDFALVDTGWLGSMQACLSLLLQHVTGRPRTAAAGYYLGMFRDGDPRYGRYSCFLFKNARELRKFSGFNNNVVECLCAADHGMTAGYCLNDGGWAPEFYEYEHDKCRSAWNARAQIEMCVSYAGYFAEANGYRKVFGNTDQLASMAGRLLLGFMARPSLAEARLYGAIPFSDGMTAGISTTLAGTMSPEQIKHKSLSYRVWNVLMGRRGQNAPGGPVYWLAGSLALSGVGSLRALNMRMLDSLYWILYG